MADPDLELRWGGGGGGLDFVALLAFFPSVISSSFAQNKGGAVPLGPSPRSATDIPSNSRFARCRHLTTTTRIPFDFSLLFKF